MIRLLRDIWWAALETVGRRDRPLPEPEAFNGEPLVSFFENLPPCPLCEKPGTWLDIRVGKRFCAEHVPAGLDEHLAWLRAIGAMPKHEPHYEHSAYRDTP